MKIRFLDERNKEKRERKSRGEEPKGDKRTEGNGSAEVYAAEFSLSSILQVKLLLEGWAEVRD